MKVLFVLCVALAAAHAQVWTPRLRVKWGAPLIESDYFITIPHTLTETIADGWVLTARPEGVHHPSLQMYCPENDYTFCSLFDDTDVIAGLQVALSATGFTDNPIDFTTLAFTKWTAPDGNEYWCQYQYFVSEETLAKSPAERIAMRYDGEITLREDAVWFPNYDGSLLRVSASESDIAATGHWKQQACVITMGMHYYNNITTETVCDRIYPWFVLTNDGYLSGSGFMVFGKFPELPSGRRMWFEQPARSAVEMIVPNSSQCVYELAENPGVTTMHIFYGRHPFRIGC